MLRVLGLVTLVALAAAGASCSVFSDEVPGCVAPSNEAQLLDEFAKERVLELTPPSVKERKETLRQVACKRFGEHASVTHVGVHHELSRNIERDEVHGLYDPVATAAGWVPLPVEVHQSYLLYCRRVAGQAAMLSVGWSEGYSVGKEQVPARLLVDLQLAHDAAIDDQAKVEAAQKAGCWPLAPAQG
ncbi:MAG TPA: hypothetical protein VF062_05640 [Candidatus Limnocylindrales bacterium]